MKNPKTNQNVSSPPDTKSPNIYPSILNMNPGTIYPDLSLSLGSAHMQQNNLSKRTNNQGLSLSISQIKANQSNQPDQERDSHDSVVTKSQKFFRNFKYQKKNQQNLDYSAILNLKMLQDLDQDAKNGKIDKQESAHSRSYNHKQSPVQENKKLSMTQMFMRKFNNCKEKNSQEDPSEDNKKQKTIKISYNQISSSSSNSQQEEQLTNVINKTKQQLKNDQQNKLATSYSYISDNLQSCNQEPALQAIIPSNKQVEGEQNFKKAIPKFEENVKNQKKQEGQKQQNEEDEEEEEDEDIFDEESQEQNVKQKMKRINSSDQNQQKIQRNQSQQQVHKNKRIEKKEQLDQKQQVFRQREKQWTSEEQEQSQIEQKQQQDEKEQIADKEDDGTVENKKSQIIGFRLYKSLTNEKIKELRQTTETYYPSNYFHAGPRHQMLGFLREIVTQIQHLATGDLTKKSDACVAQIENLMKINTAINILQDLGQKVRLYLKEDVISEILNVISQYNCCNYFHVGPRRQVFSWVLYLISLVEKSRKNITQKNSSKPQGPNGLKGNSDQVQQEQLQKQKEEQQKEQEEQEQQQELEQQQEGQQDENDNDDAEEQEEQEEDDDDDDQDQDEANDVINNSIHDLLSNYANNDISFLSTQRSLNIQKREENSVKLSVEEIKNFEIGKKLKQMLTPALIQSLGQTLMQYNSSNYFHVGPRYQLLGFIREYAKFVQRILKNGGTTKIDSNLNDIFLKKSIKMGEEVKKYMTVGKIQQVVSTCQSYDSSNYFHVGPRSSIFGDVRKLISISQL